MNSNCDDLVLTQYTAQAILMSAKKQISLELERFEFLSDSLNGGLDEINDNQCDFGVLIDTLESAIQQLLLVKPYLFNQKKLKEMLSDS
ncbi:MAG: hypothetical protein H0X33_13125 [Taibaiella sp.]|nr:hypothetical protein [Taibaiella sp.]